jgi:hypothetical protein
MLKRFWPLLTIVIIVVLAAIIIPATATLMPKLNKLQYESKVYLTILSITTSLNSFPDDVKEGEPFEISGRLSYVDKTYVEQMAGPIEKEVSETGEISAETIKNFLHGSMIPTDALTPLPDQKIMVSIEGGYVTLYYDEYINTHSTQTVFTDKDGYFNATIQVDDISQWHRWVSAHYDGEKRWATSEDSRIPTKIIYLPSSISIPESKITPRRVGIFSNISTISIVAYVFTGIFVAFIAYFIYRYRKQIRAWFKRRKTKATAEPVNTKQQLSTVEAVQDVFAGDPRIEILFPQIENPLPLVWGTGEPLTIMGHVLIENAEKEINSKPQIRTEDHSLIITTPDLSPVKIEHSFNIKGETDINVYFGVDTNDKIFGTRKIKIVDYREEIVELFNHLIDSLSAKGIAVNRMMTAREIESKLTGNYSDFSPDTMKDVVKGFEYANYSLHPVARKIYVDMYVAVEKVRERIKNV